MAEVLTEFAALVVANGPVVSAAVGLALLSWFVRTFVRLSR